MLTYSHAAIISVVHFSGQGFLKVVRGLLFGHWSWDLWQGRLYRTCSCRIEMKKLQHFQISNTYSNFNNYRSYPSFAMFDDLLDSFEETLKQAKLTATSLNKQFRQTLTEFGVSDNFHDPTRKLGKAVSFPKSERFKELEKQPPRTTDSFYDSVGFIEETTKKGVVFTKSDRFAPLKQDELTIINPNYDVVKKNNKQAPKITPVSQKQLNKSRMSQATAASQTQVGPGKYFVNEVQVENGKKVPSFSKSKRFQKPKQIYEDNPLFLNDCQVKKRPPTMAVLKKKVEKNKNQISVEQQEDLRERLKLVYWKSIPLELDRLMKKHLGAPILKQKYFNLKNMNSRQRRCALLMLLDRLNFQRGGFNNEIKSQIGKGRTAVVYRKSTPKPFKFSEMEPGPDYYYPLDDLTKPGAIGFTFGKHQEKPAQPDNRDYQIQDEYFKTGGNILIMPQHKEHKLTDEQITSLNRGPGFYDCLFSQVEKRTDIGVVKFQPITEKNARENNCIQIKEANDGVYFPSYGAIDANIPGPIYSKPADVKPMHMPDKDLFPEHWLFYDGDLNKVRAEIAKNVLIGNGLEFEQYQKFTKKFNAFKNYMQLRRKQVEALQYQPKFDIIDPHVEGFDMSKKPEKTLIQPIVKDQFDVDGDNLILSPEKLKKRVAQINFQKMVGREENQIKQDDIIEGDVLIIHPKKPQKHVAEIDFKMMVARPEIRNDKNEDEQAAEGDRIILNPMLPENKLPNIDFSKQSERIGPMDKLLEQKQQKEELFILPEQPKKIKGFVDMQRMTSVRLVPYLRKRRQEKASVIKPRSKSKKSEIGSNEEEI